MNLSLYGKKAIIGGSTQGIGLAIAQELALAGADCILLSRNEESLKAAINTLHTEGSEEHGYLVADFTNPEQLRSIIQDYVKTNTVEILINNTGGPSPGLITEEDEQKFIDCFQQHIVCNQVLAKAVIPGMKQAGYGRIINIISTSVRIPIANLGVSNTIRAAVAAWAKTLSNEVGAYGITVNSILPGNTWTNRLASVIKINAERRGVNEEVIINEMKEKSPLKRFADTKEIAAVAAFLASPAASYVNGITIPVDGGATGTI